MSSKKNQLQNTELRLVFGNNEIKIQAQRNLLLHFSPQSGLNVTVNSS